MLHRFPHYYPAFRCIDGACRDNCCRAGWEIDIDPDTLARYRRVPGELGRRLDEQIDSSGEAPCFRLDREGVCPFLTREGLCELYLRLGPDALCEICREHPRFHSWHGPFRESGLGLCCEEACRLILTDRAPFALLEQTDPEPEEPAEDPLFLSRVEEVRRVCFAVAQDRCRTVRQRMQLLLCLGDELQELIGEFNLKRIAISNETQSDTRDEEKLQRLNGEMRHIYARIMQNENMTAYNRAKEDFDRLLQRISAIISQSADGEDPNTADYVESCGGNCSACGGCG